MLRQVAWITNSCPHQENQLVAFVNLNMGPGECVWICVSMIYAAKMEKLMNEKRISPYHTKYWPTEQDLIDAGTRSSFRKPAI
ncbi:hypothetical protein GCK72_021212 [Caenorhabditis remanei]|uniref:JmjC domain-containing protein n=1 Tax=Caenorhabditis remanei TaxID=31234 RepID=A0A6A5GJZ2_CAERE|nr:hypothetical protein GCK72_021212 [Caenorhabditis remanei]KAF1754649.1 hypothetical protein GCK72_021212 [Caenorhabditis remanei]